MTKTARQKKNISIWITTLLTIFAIIGIKTWMDLQYKAPQSMSDHIPVIYGYQTNDIQTFEQYPKRMGENVLDAGTFTPNGLDSPSYDLKTLSKAQPRILNILYSFRGTAPYARTQHHIDTMAQDIARYRYHGIQLHEIFIDYRPDNINDFDFERLNDFTAQLRETFQREYALGVFLNDHWFRTETHEDQEISLRRLGNMSKHVRTFFFDYDEARQESEDLVQFIERLNAYKFAYVLRTQNKEDMETITSVWKSPSGFFIGLLIDFDPNAPTSTEQDKTSGETK